jgi:hypothetical protein
MKYELRSIGFWSFVKIAFVVNFIAGIIAGVFFIPFGFVLLGLLELSTLPDTGSYVDEGSPVGALMILMPIISAFGAAVIGTFFQSMVVLIYNILASSLGGLRLSLQPSDEEPPETTPVAPSRSVNPSDAIRRPPPPPPPRPGGPPEITPDGPETPPEQPRVAPPAMNTYSPPPRIRPSNNEPENE